MSVFRVISVDAPNLYEAEGDSVTVRERCGDSWLSRSVYLPGPRRATVRFEVDLHEGRLPELHALLAARDIEIKAVPK